MRLRPLLLDALDTRQPRPLMGPGGKDFQLAPRPLRHNFDITVGEVAHPPRKPQRVRLLGRRMPEKHALDAPVNEHPEPRKVRLRHQRPSSPPTRAKNSRSSSVLTPSSRALRSLEPASAPTTTKSVLRLTEELTRPPAARIFCSASSRVSFSSVPVSTKVLSRRAPRPSPRGTSSGASSSSLSSRWTTLRLR